MRSSSTGPKTRESWLEGRLSPITKYSCSPTIQLKGQSGRLQIVGEVSPESVLRT